MSVQCSTQYLSVKIPAPIPGQFCSSSPKLKLHQPKKEVFVRLALIGSLHKFDQEQTFEAWYLTWGGSRTRPLTFVSSGLNFIPNSLISGSLSYLFTSMAWKKNLIVRKVLLTDPKHIQSLYTVKSFLIKQIPRSFLEQTCTYKAQISSKTL